MTNTELCQLMKLPVLVQHYREHRHMDKGISFFAYLHMHYVTDHANDPDHDRDMQLPFKTDASALLAATNVATPILNPHITITIPYKEITQHFSVHYPQWISSGNNNEIFQPPRLS